MNQDIRNIGIIAHVDHGKTTLVDAIFRQSGLWRDNQQVVDRVMDSNDLEREKGITILSKVASVTYQGTKINILDTPGHSDFGAEVERVLHMVDGVLLIVDAQEGPMAQTRFVLRKALQMKLKPILVINKIDRDGARPSEVIDKTHDLFIDLGADEEILFNLPIVYASGANGYAKLDLNDESQDLRPLLDMILNEIPPPQVGGSDEPFQLQVANLDYNDYLGRMFGGKVLRGIAKVGEQMVVAREDGEQKRFAISKLWEYTGIKLQEVEQAQPGNIVMLSGFDDVMLGDTVCHPSNVEALPNLEVDQPTMSMSFYANNSPFSGRDGKFLTIHKIRERLVRESKSSVSMKVNAESSEEGIEVYARGELQLAIIIETMRRESFELAVSRPQVILKKIDGRAMEPIETLDIEVMEEYLGSVMEELARRKGDMIDMSRDEHNNVQVSYEIPTRGLIGFRSQFLTLTRGTGIMAHAFKEYAPFRGEMATRLRGSLIAKEDGQATAYAIADIEERGTLFVPPGTDVYGGMVVGENSRQEDMVVNIVKAKKLTNMRASSADTTVTLEPPREFLLEEMLSWIKDDELVEITPGALRFRKRILAHNERRVDERRTAEMINA